MSSHPLQQVFSVKGMPNPTVMFKPTVHSTDGPNRLPNPQLPGTFVELTESAKSVINACTLTGIQAITPATVHELAYRLFVLKNLGTAPCQLHTPEGPVPTSLPPHLLTIHLGLTVNARPFSNSEFDTFARSQYHVLFPFPTPPPELPHGQPSPRPDNPDQPDPD